MAGMVVPFLASGHAGRVDEDSVVDVCEQLDQLDIRTDVVGNSVQRVTRAVNDHGLTAYDVRYLLLAQDRGLPLTALDRDLADAAASVGVPLAV